MAIVDLPTPPLPEATATIDFTSLIPPRPFSGVWRCSVGGCAWRWPPCAPCAGRCAVSAAWTPLGFSASTAAIAAWRNGLERFRFRRRHLDREIDLAIDEGHAGDPPRRNEIAATRHRDAFERALDRVFVELRHHRCHFRAASSSFGRASTQRSPSARCSFFQKGPRTFTWSHHIVRCLDRVTPMR